MSDNNTTQLFSWILRNFSGAAHKLLVVKMATIPILSTIGRLNFQIVLIGSTTTAISKAKLGASLRRNMNFALTHFPWMEAVYPAATGLHRNVRNVTQVINQSTEQIATSFRQRPSHG